MQDDQNQDQQAHDEAAMENQLRESRIVKFESRGGRNPHKKESEAVRDGSFRGGR